MMGVLGFLLIIPVAELPTAGLPAAGSPAPNPGLALPRGGVAARQWVFGGDPGRTGWTAGRDVVAESGPEDVWNFRSEGSDPMIFSPSFDPMPVRIGQWIELCLRTDMAGRADVFWSTTPETEYGGFTPGQIVSFSLRPGRGYRVYRVLPPWQREKAIIRLRLDFPAGGPGHHSLRWVRVCEAAASSGADAPATPDFWIAGGADVDAGSWPVILGGPSGAESLLSSPFRSPQSGKAYVLLDLEAETDTELSVSVEGQGFEVRVPDRIPALRRARRCRLNVEVPFPPDVPGARACVLLETLSGLDGRVRVHSIEVSPTSSGPPLLLAEAFGPRGKVFARRGDRLDVFLRVRNWGGSTAEGVISDLNAPAQLEILSGRGARPIDVPPGKSAEWQWTVRSTSTGSFPLRFAIAGQPAAAAALPLRFHERPTEPCMGRIPEPEPAPTEYEIGVYYFPRWFEAQYWAPILPFPERKPLLGWYVDLSPDVADWHISWCAASGISFFIYDWYWEQGQRRLYGGLEDAYLKARYRKDLKFCLLWANHNRPNTHSREDLLEVTRFWIENYFRVPGYYTIDGRPVIVVFAPRNVRHDLGSDEAVREAFGAMRSACRAAGVGPVYLVACGTGDDRTQASFAAQGYDAGSGYNYPGISGKKSVGDGYAAQIEGYRELWNQAAAANHLPHIPVLSGGWDSRPWHGPKALARPGRTPELFRRHLRDAKRFLDRRNPKNKTVLFIEAWNEWGEGSYIEPHAEFGFDYLQAIRDVFCTAKGRWEPVLPSDVGLSVPLVTALEKPTVEPTDPPSWTVRVPQGQWDIGGTMYQLAADRILPVSPATLVEVQGEDQILRDGPLQKWAGGTVLKGSLGPHARTRLPLAIDPDSVVVRSATDASLVYREGVDYELDPEYGGLARKPGGAVPGDAVVRVDYRHYLPRIDGVDLLPDGQVVVTPGEPVKVCPLPPSVPPGAVRVANILVPCRCESIRRENIFPVPQGGTGRIEEVPLFYTAAEFLSGTRTRLTQGRPVTIVFLGDSVTVGGDATAPERTFVGAVQNLIRRRFPKVELRVVNAGVGGTNSDFALERLDRDVLAHRPQLVVVEFVNDMGFPPLKVEDNYRRLIARIRKAGADCILLTPHFVRPAWMEGFAPAAQAVRDVACAEGVALGDVSASWAALAEIGIPYESLLANGINHPDDRGHRIYADTIMSLLTD